MDTIESWMGPYKPLNIWNVSQPIPDNQCPGCTFENNGWTFVIDSFQVCANQGNFISQLAYLQNWLNEENIP